MVLDYMSSVLQRSPPFVRGYGLVVRTTILFGLLRSQQETPDSKSAVVHTLLEYTNAQDTHTYLSSLLGRNFICRADCTWARYLLRGWFRMDYNNWTIAATRNFARLFYLFDGQLEACDEGEELLQDFRQDKLL